MRAIYCALSAVGFGVMAIFAKLAYADGVSVNGLLLVRFGLAGLILLPIAKSRGTFADMDRRSVLIGLSMGAVGYASQAGLYFAALTRSQASQVALVFCTYPLLVMIAAIVIGRERVLPRRIAALTTALLGMALVLGSASSESVDALGVLLAAGAAGVYTGYILVGDKIAPTVSPLPLSALVCLGAFGTFTMTALLRGGASVGFAQVAWIWLALLAIVCTVAPVVLFFAGLAGVGPTVASLLGTIEPVVTVVAAAIVFGESLSIEQAIGGVLVLCGVVLVQMPDRGAHPQKSPDGGPGRAYGEERAPECV